MKMILLVWIIAVAAGGAAIAGQQPSASINQGVRSEEPMQRADAAISLIDTKWIGRAVQ
jgi:hypothetical protein